MAEINETTPDPISTVDDLNDLDLELDAESPAAGTPSTEADQLKSAIKQKIVWRDRAIEPSTKKTYKSLYEEAIKTAAPSVPQPVKVDAQAALASDVQSLKEESLKRQFQHVNGLTPVEVDDVFAWAKGKGIEPKAALEDEFLKGVLASRRSKEESSNAVMSPSRRAPHIIGGKPFGQMTEAERRASYQR